MREACRSVAVRYSQSEDGPVSSFLPHSEAAIMEARATLFGHSIHQMLIPFPFGLLATGVIFDIVRISGGAPKFSEIA